MSINAKEIAVDQIIPTPQNRRHIDTKSEKWKEFVESVRKNGVLTPLLVRPMPDHGGGHSPAELDDLAHAALVDRDCLMDLGAGHRRLAAATAELPEPASWAREEAAPKRAKPAKPAKEAKHARPKSKAKAAK